MNRRNEWKVKKKDISKERKDELDEKVRNADIEIIESLKREQTEYEEIISCSLRRKMEYSHKRKVPKNKKTEIGWFRAGEEYENDSRKTWLMVTEQYKSVFSTRNRKYTDDEMFNQSDENSFTDVQVQPLHL